MGLTLDDLQPKPFTIKLKEHVLTSKPLKLSHALMLAKVGDVFQNASTATVESIKDAEKTVMSVITDLIPELEGIELDMSLTMSVMQQLMDHIEPSDDKELKEKGVVFGSDDPKDQVAG